MTTSVENHCVSAPCSISKHTKCQQRFEGRRKKHKKPEFEMTCQPLICARDIYNSNVTSRVTCSLVRDCHKRSIKEKKGRKRKKTQKEGKGKKKREENEKKRGNGNSTRQNIELATINKAAENACVKVDFNIEHIYFIPMNPILLPIGGFCTLVLQSNI